MPLVATRVLIINRQIKFSTTLKQALEQTGQFEVSPFTSASAALDFLKDKPQHIALVDFGITDMQGIDAILQLRSIQPDLAIIASPNDAEIVKIADDLVLQGVISFPISARKLIPLLEQAYDDMRDSLPDTRDAPAIGDDSDTLNIHPPPDSAPEFSSLESVLVHIGGLSDDIGTSTIPVDMDSAGYALENNKLQAPRSIEFVIRGDLADAEQASQDAKSKEEITLFQQLVAEEPPLPKFEDSGTVGDLMIGVGDTNLREVIKILKQNEKQPELPLPPKVLKPDGEIESDSETNTARMILNKALDQTTPLTLSLDAILKDIDQIDEPSSPSLGKARLLGQVDAERFVREPDFLPEESKDLPETIVDEGVDDAPIEDDTAPPEVVETEAITQTPPPPPMGVPEHTSVIEDDVVDEVQEESRENDLPFSFAETGPIDPADEIEYQTGFGTQPLADLADTAYVEEPEPELTSEVVADDVDISKLALGLTQASVDLTADATILTFENEVVEFAGKLVQEDIEDLGDEIENDWGAKNEEARIRFIHLRSNGEDYMLYSRQTEGGYTLTLVFAGNMPLRAVRRQYDQLLEALHTIPDEDVTADAIDDAEIAEMEAQLEQIESENTAQMEAVNVDELARPENVGPLTAYTFVWLVLNDDISLNGDVALAIVNKLDHQLSNIGWHVQSLRVHEDFVYIMADVPGEEPANDTIADLKKRTAQIAKSVDDHINPELLWADSYLAFVPGRELEVVEIQRYISFARARG